MVPKSYNALEVSQGAARFRPATLGSNGKTAHQVVLMLRRLSCQRISLEIVTVSGTCVESHSITCFPATAMVEMALPSLPAS